MIEQLFLIREMSPRICSVFGLKQCAVLQISLLFPLPKLQGVVKCPDEKNCKTMIEGQNTIIDLQK